MTNGDKIRSMTDEELARFLEKVGSGELLWCDENAQIDEDGKCVKWDCNTCAEEWLNEEWEEKVIADDESLIVEFNKYSDIHLKPCPKCGAVPNAFKWYKGMVSVRCPCGMYAVQENYEPDETDMKKIVDSMKLSWNRLVHKEKKDASVG